MHSPFFSVRWLLLALLILPACQHPVAVPSSYQASDQEGWLKARALGLNLDLDAARARDLALSERQPPPVDAALELEAASLWASQCSSCHGLTGKLEQTAQQDPAPRKFGTFGMTMGFTMGRDKMRAGIYRKIRDGGPPVNGAPSQMPAYGGRLSREQIWGLVAHIEGL